jgi:hypothetical protein
LPDARIPATSRPDGHHAMLRFTWRLIRGDGTVNDGVDFGELDGHGRIKRIVGFFGPFPQPGR